MMNLTHSYSNVCDLFCNVLHCTVCACILRAGEISEERIFKGRVTAPVPQIGRAVICNGTSVI